MDKCKDEGAGVDDKAQVIDDKIKAFMTLFDIKHVIVEATDINERVEFVRRCINI